MKGSRIAALAGLAIVALTLGWLLFVAVPGWYRTPDRAAATAAVAGTDAATAGPKISAKLFYVGADGRVLTSVEREVPYAERTTDQARAILVAQLEPAPAPYVSPIPPGTTLRAVYVTDKGEAFVDVSGEIVTAHPGGSTYERLTVYALVNALTVNLPAVRAVQLLVDGREVNTLAGHIDLRAPLAQRVERPAEPDDTPGPAGTADNDQASEITPAASTRNQEPR